MAGDEVAIGGGQAGKVPDEGRVGGQHGRRLRVPGRLRYQHPDRVRPREGAPHATARGVHVRARASAVLCAVPMLSYDGQRALLRRHAHVEWPDERDPWGSFGAVRPVVEYPPGQAGAPAIARHGAAHAYPTAWRHFAGPVRQAERTAGGRIVVYDGGFAGVYSSVMCQVDGLGRPPRHVL